MPYRALSCAASLALLLGACTGSRNDTASTDSMPPAAQSAGVRAVLTLERDTVAPGDSIAVALQVVNATTEPVVLEYTSGQRYDLWVTRPDGESLWTWSADKLFMQALGEETVSPGDTLLYRDTAPAPAEPGEYLVVGSVTASNRDLADTVRVTVRP